MTPEMKKIVRKAIGDWGPLIISPGLPQYKQGTKEAFRSDFDLTHPKDWPQWLKNMHTEHACVEVTKSGLILWWGGTVHDGLWMGENTVWINGCFRDGTWLGGTWLNGFWAYGEKRAGEFLAGTWRDGMHRGGLFRGVWERGQWLGGTFDGFHQRTQTPPPMFT